MELEQSLTLQDKKTIDYKNNYLHIESRAGVIKISCLDYNKKYVSETWCSHEKRIYEWKRDFKKETEITVLFKHNVETNHNFNF